MKFIETLLSSEVPECGMQNKFRTRQAIQLFEIKNEHHRWRTERGTEIEREME